MLRSLSVLRNRDFALIWTSSTVSNTGTWMQVLAVAALITELTNQARWGGFVAAASYLATGLVTPFGGVLADRYDRRRLIVIAAAFQALLGLALAGLYSADLLSPLVLVALTTVEGALVAIAWPARQAMTPDLVPADQILDAAALSSASYNLGRIVGPALGGLVLTFGDYSTIFLVNAVSLVLVAASLLLVRTKLSVPVLSTDGVWKRLSDGARGAWKEPGCRAAITWIALLAVTVSPFIALIPAMAQIVFGGDAVETSRLITAQGVGAVAGAVFLPSLASRFGRGRFLSVSMAASAIALCAYAQAPSLLVATGILVILGAAYISVLSGLSAVVQVRAPKELRARVLSLHVTALALAYPLGASVQGWLADELGTRYVQSAGGITFLLALCVLRLFKPGLFRHLDDGTADLAQSPKG